MDQLQYLIKTYNIRLKRFMLHLVYPLYRRNVNHFPPGGIMEWCIDLIFYSMDILLLPEIYFTVMRSIKWNIRPLNHTEINLAHTIFKQNINLLPVRIDSASKFATNKIAIAYVSFNMINYRVSLSNEVFIHELMHIWQYQKFGSIYIARAIKAQRSHEGYDYGGLENLFQVMVKGGKLTDFNFEQQADIIEDYYKYCVRTNHAKAMERQVYTYFAMQLDDEIL